MRIWLSVLMIGSVACSIDLPEESEPSALEDHSCRTIGGDSNNRGAWFNYLLPQQYGPVDLLFTATPKAFSGTTVDGVIGLSNDEADAFADLGPIVRFNPQGFIDVRNCSIYTAGTRINYIADGQSSYRIRMRIDIPTRRYSVWVKPPEVDNEIAIASNFAFRSEQSSMSRIDMLAGKMDSNGAVQLCNLHTGPTNCHPSQAGDPWDNTAFRTYRGRFGVDIMASVGLPTEENVDAVIGLSRTTASRFSDLAAIVRFNPSGYFDVRDGSSYRADGVFPYNEGWIYTFHFVVDLAAGHYSVWVDGLADTPTFIANNYRLRTEQTGVSSISSMAQFIDSETGSLQTCELMANEIPW
jgi:hypothetical protein